MPSATVEEQGETGRLIFLNRTPGSPEEKALCGATKKPSTSPLQDTKLASSNLAIVVSLLLAVNAVTLQG